MKNLLLACLLTAPAGAWAAAGKAEVSALFDKLMHEGKDAKFDFGDAVAIEGESEGEALTLAAVVSGSSGGEKEAGAQDSEEASEAPAVVQDLLYRRSFDCLLVIREAASVGKSGAARAEKWVYIVGFDGAILGFKHDFHEGRDNLSETRDPGAPEVREGWDRLVPRLRKLSARVTF